jgi:lipid II:glycine glycyltransferase (peptidoglycan interpeptide bridge formation enzyme)
MKSSIKIIKPKRDEDPKDLQPSENEKSVERSTREMVTTVKSWIAELQKRKRAQVQSFSHLTVIATAPANQNTR